MERSKPAAIDRATALRYMGASGWTPDAATAALLDKAEQTVLTAAAPRAVYRRLPRTALPLENCGSDLTRHLQGCDEVLLLAATLGAEVDKLLRRMELTDIALAAAADALASVLLAQVCDELENSISAQIEAQGGVLILLHDVTEQHRNEERRKEFVANVSHELRTPLTNVRWYAETIRDAGDGIPRRMENNFLDISITETDRMTHIVRDLLTLSRLDAGSTEMVFTRFPFHDAIESVVRSNSLNAKQRGHELTYVPEGELPLITGDRSRLEQVMMNILGNAIKYTPDRGHIRVTAGAGADTVWMEVCDDGIGIPEKDRDRIFIRFYWVDKARSRESGGTGLGLSIAKEIVQRHHGTISLVPHEGPGTTVRLELPITQPAPGAPGDAAEGTSDQQTFQLLSERRDRPCATGILFRI